MIEDGRSMIVLAIIVPVAAMYFSPTMLALGQRSRSIVPIALLNTFLGWTIMGWAAALLWAALGRTRDQNPSKMTARTEIELLAPDQWLEVGEMGDFSPALELTSTRLRTPHV